MMKNVLTVAALAALLLPMASHARDTTHHLDFDSVVAEATQAGRLDGSVKFYLAGEAVPGKVERIREAVTNKKTNAFGKSDEVACAWVLQSALITLQDAAKQAGANAVVDVVSYYKRKEFKDAEKYECHAGAVIAGVALKGQLAKTQ